MSDWFEIQEEFESMSHEVPEHERYKRIRHKYLKQLHEQTGRSVITYYSGAIQHPQLGKECMIDDSDTLAFMTLSKQLKHKEGLDLFLHTYGGNIGAAQTIISCLRQLYGANIRVFVPQIALSAGTLLACAAKQIIMASQSSLGPVDPQIRRYQAHGVIREFNQAKKDAVAEPKSRHAWKPILSQYSPTLIDTCKQNIEWSKDLLKQTLSESMFLIEDDDEECVKSIKAKKVDELVNILTLSDEARASVHRQRFSRDVCKDTFGLNVKDIFQLDTTKNAEGKHEGSKPTVYAIHWANICTLESKRIVKIIENHEGKSLVRPPYEDRIL